MGYFAGFFSTNGRHQRGNQCRSDALVLVAFAGALLGFGGCGDTAPQADVDGGVDGVSASEESAEASASTIGGTRESFCAGTGAPVVVGDSTSITKTCAGEIAARTFRSALCACRTVSVAGALTTDAGDSSDSSFAADDMGGGAVGTNDVFSVGGKISVGGSLTVAGSKGLFLAGGDHEVLGDVSASGRFGAAGGMDISRDFSLDGTLVGAGTLSIGRDLIQTPGELQAFTGSLEVAGEVVREDVQVDAPCACDAEDLLDVSALVAAAAENNDNDEADLDADALTNVAGEERVELPCGRFYVDSVGGAGALTLVVNGRTALFVEKNVAMAGSLEVELGTKGELDVFIKGNLVSAGTITFGSEERPAATRVYVAGDQAIALAGRSAFVGNLYAPQAVVTGAGALEVFGSVFAKDFAAAGRATIHYDRAILEAGKTCEAPPTTTTCETCGMCDSSQACMDGACGACEGDSDCCDPLVCVEGRCESLLL